MHRSLATNLIIILVAVDTASADEMLTVRTNPYHVNAGAIAQVSTNGTVAITKLSNPRLVCGDDGTADSDLAEGHYLAFLGVDTDFAFDAFELPPKGTWVSPIEIISIDHKNQATATFPAAAMKRLNAGQRIAVFRPPGTTTAAVKSIPVADVEEPSERIHAISKLLMIGQALHHWRETYGGFPPVVVRGPDGTPWHSWRVLILPFLDHGDLFNKYHFDEPWNGPNNKKLLKEVPDVYRFSSDKRFSDTSTHFLSIVGAKTAFNPQGLTNHNPEHWLIGDYKPGIHGMKVEDFSDGPSATLLIGTANPQKPVEWLKPSDVTFSQQLAGPGTPQSFGAPVAFQRKQQGVFLWADGSVSTIESSVQPQVFRSLFTIKGGEKPIDNKNRRRAISDRMGSIGINASSTIQFYNDNGRRMARIVFRQ